MSDLTQPYLAISPQTRITPTMSPSTLSSSQVTQNTHTHSSTVTPETEMTTPTLKEEIPEPSGDPATDSELSDGEVVNDVDGLWTWELNGTPITISGSLITGAIRCMQRFLQYWSENVITIPSKIRQKFTEWTAYYDLEEDYYYESSEYSDEDL